MIKKIVSHIIRRANLLVFIKLSYLISLKIINITIKIIIVNWFCNNFTKVVIIIIKKEKLKKILKRIIWKCKLWKMLLKNDFNFILF